MRPPATRAASGVRPRPVAVPRDAGHDVARGRGAGRRRPVFPPRRAGPPRGPTGPLARSVVAGVALVGGLEHSTVQPADSLQGMKLGSPLLLQGLSALLVKAPPEGHDLLLH